jgi:uncharacterized protein YkwD
MKSFRNIYILLAFMLPSIVPAVSQVPDVAHVTYYSGVGDTFRLKPFTAKTAYFINLEVEKSQYSKLMVKVSKAGSYSDEQVLYSAEPPAPFNIKYLLKKGPGNYTVVIFGNRGSGGYYSGLCTFTLTSTENVPGSVLKAEQDEFENRIKAEIKLGFEYLNKVRANPGAYSREIGVNLNGISPLPPLVWDERLAASAAKRAADMAKRNYFSHVNPDGIGPNFFVRQEGYILPAFWSTSKSTNNVESISAGYEGGVANVINLINDGGASNASAGHRIHLLGLNSFFKGHTKIGIGLAHSQASTYKYYFVIHTAPPEGK